MITVELIKTFLSKNNYIKIDVCLESNRIAIINKNNIQYARNENELDIWKTSEYSSDYLKLSRYNINKYIDNSYFNKFITKFKDNLELFDLIEKECLR
jgi:hypothetical protein